MDAKTGGDHSFLVQIWHPRGPHDNPNQPAIFLGSASPGSQHPTIMLRDSQDCMLPLSDVKMRLFLPPGQDLRAQSFYDAQEQTLPQLGPYRRMQMHVQGQLVPEADVQLSSHPWCRCVPAQRLPEALLAAMQQASMGWSQDMLMLACLQVWTSGV